MKISEFIEQLKKLQEEHGDIEVKTQTLSHTWAPEMTVQVTGPLPWNKYVLLNS